MAEYIIKADTEMIRGTTDKIEAQRNYMEGYMNEMQSKINDLQNYFKSAAGNEFVSKYSNVSNDIKACLANLGTEITGLRNAAGILETASQGVDTDVNALPTTGVFNNP
ncbi:MAG: WXG100 family type VII secretion target [Eubacterium sp.]|nr:WXG100 family type VII secretion target [Eubacterium sp.]